eukprot:823994-Prymnesium_polylepis.1
MSIKQEPSCTTSVLERKDYSHIPHRCAPSLRDPPPPGDTKRTRPPLSHPPSTQRGADAQHDPRVPTRYTHVTHGRYAAGGAQAAHAAHTRARRTRVPSKDKRAHDAALAAEIHVAGTSRAHGIVLKVMLHLVTAHRRNRR